MSLYCRSCHTTHRLQAYVDEFDEDIDQVLGDVRCDRI
ncbi:MAG: dual CXXC motif small (seleno)protein [Desulfobacterales bacterium]